MDRIEIKGSTALVTGASSGIGLHFAEELARRGARLVLTARSRDALDELASKLRSAHGTQVDVVVADLAEPKGADAVLAAIDARSLQIDILINNAGVGRFAALSETPVDVCERLLQLNILAMVRLTRSLLPGMQQRGRGGVLNVASMAAFMPLPYVALYGASKAFVLSFSQAIAVESAEFGVHVMALCPGNTRTGFESAARADLSGVPSDAPEEVARRGLDALMRGKRLRIHGLANLFSAQLMRFVPWTLQAGLMARMTVKQIAGVRHVAAARQSCAR